MIFKRRLEAIKSSKGGKFFTPPISTVGQIEENVETVGLVKTTEVHSSDILEHEVQGEEWDEMAMGRIKDIHERVADVCWIVLEIQKDLRLSPFGASIDFIGLLSLFRFFDCSSLIDALLSLRKNIQRDLENLAPTFCNFSEVFSSFTALLVIRLNQRSNNRSLVINSVIFVFRHENFESVCFSHSRYFVQS
ncbi:hypothetical protein Nepgr_014965 [Nepenthes gracilis]|uniref:Uncharacterized protein n=1 Tax=Nepenthes gracilis TaxID=150966 RepID=A0AAD3XQP4_NEPGR|nr:hypothetical protein Nepgr_014965 [Nepenthes gracilis]